MAKPLVMSDSEVRSRRARGARNKGKGGEREVIALLQPVVNEVYVAHEMEPPRLQRNLLQADLGGCDMHGLEWFAPEVKFHEANYAPAWWTQAVRQAGNNRVPVLFYRRSRVDWQVRMYVTLCQGCTVPATVDVEAFLKWFRLALTVEVGREAQKLGKD